jgi:SAM-dependent methyltransferase
MPVSVCLARRGAVFAADMRFPPQPTRRVSCRSFGYLPSGRPLRDLYGWLFGSRNLLKRLQARDILAALDLRAHEAVLDFGCGTGFMTVEMAKLAHRAVGIDVDPRVGANEVPPFLAERLSFLEVSGIDLPFADCTFDVVLASEVLPMVEDPQVFLSEIVRVLRPGGRAIVVNGTGHPAIRTAYRGDHFLLRAARRIWKGVPSDYSTYEAKLQASFGTAQGRFFGRDDLILLLNEAGLECEGVAHSPRKLAGAWISWSQFVRVVRGGPSLRTRLFVGQLAAWSLVSLLDRRDYEGGVILAARKSLAR